MSVFTQMPDEAKTFYKDWFTIKDNYPVTEGHTLIVPARQVVSFFQLNASEWEELKEVIRDVTWELQQDLGTTNFNIGVNEGPLAGRTVPHLHIHVIPRYEGDMSDPRGGVRHVIPDQGNYKMAEKDMEDMAAYYQATAFGAG